MKKIIGVMKNVFNKFPVTYISSIIISLSYILFYENNYEVFDILSCFFAPLCVAAFFTETLFDVRKKKLYYLLPIILGTIWCILTRFETITNSVVFTRLLVFYYISLPLVSFYYNYKNASESFSKYLISCFSNLLETFIVYIVLNIGLIAILALFDFLIIDGVLSDYIDDVLVLLLGGYLLPRVVYSFYNYDEVNKFINILVTKVLFILVVISYIIVYIYIFKMLFTLNVPSNILYRILSILFIVSFIVNIMCYDIETNKVLNIIHKILPYLFIPFIILQCYSLGVRLIDNGFTVTRYLGIILIIFEIIYIIFYILKKDEGKLLFVIVILLFISLVLPYVNCYDYPINSQYKYIVKYKMDHKVTGKVRGAYNYLIDYPEGNKKIDKILTNEEKQLIESYNEYKERYGFYYNYDKNIMNIDGYKSFEIVYDYDKDEIRSKDLYNRLKQCIKENNDRCFDDNNELIIDDNTKIIVKNISCDYYEDIIEYYYAEYYLLKR